MYTSQLYANIFMSKTSYQFARWQCFDYININLNLIYNTWTCVNILCVKHASSITFVELINTGQWTKSSYKFFIVYWCIPKIFSPLFSICQVRWRAYTANWSGYWDTGVQLCYKWAQARVTHSMYNRNKEAHIVVKCLHSVTLLKSWPWVIMFKFFKKQKKWTK